MRSIIGMIGGVIMAGYVLYYAIPMLSYEKTATASIFNATDPTISLAQTMGTGFYSALPLFGVLAAAFLIIAIALRYLPGD